MLLGYNANDSDAPIRLSAKARKQGTYVIGTTGTGKTTFLLNLILQDIASRDASGNPEGLCVLDPHGDFTNDILERLPSHRLDDVILFDPADTEFPLGLNLFDCNRDDPRERDRVVSTVIDTLYKLFWQSWGPRMEDLLRHSILSLLLHPEPTSFLDLMLLLNSHEHRQRLTAAAKRSDPILRSYWNDEFPESEPPTRVGGKWRKPTEQVELVSSSLNKIGRFLVNPIIRNIIVQERSAINFRQIMDEGKIVLVNLSKGDLGPDNAALLGSVIVNQLFLAALSRRNRPERTRRPFHLYVDEYQTFATRTFPELQSEARKYAIDTLVAHQYRAQLDQENQGSTLNVANLIVLRVSGRDASELAAQYDLTPPEPEVRFEPIRRPVDDTGTLWVRDVSVGTGTQFEQQVAGTRQTYSDVQLETANLLARLPNHQAIGRILMENGQLADYRMNLPQKPPSTNSEAAEYVRKRSRWHATPRQQVEEYILRRTATSADDDSQGTSYAGVEIGD